MSAELRTITTDEIARVMTVDFVTRFNGGIAKLEELLGITRRITATAGTALKQLKVTGTLQSGAVDEGDVIPLSQYETEEVSVGEVAVNKWRKSTTLEAIQKGGYQQAVGATTAKMLKDVQKKIRTDLVGYLANGTGTASGAGLQAALANAWGVLQTKFEDDAVETVYILNPTDVATYLGSATITIQEAFGMNYVENFLGLGTAILSSLVPAGTFYATAKENVVTYAVDVSTGDIANRFDLVTDETGLIGISEFTDKTRACVEDLVVSGVTFFPEIIDGIVVGTITNPQ